MDTNSLRHILKYLFSLVIIGVLSHGTYCQESTDFNHLLNGLEKLDSITNPNIAPTHQPDSAHEYKSYGFTETLYRWHFDYGINNKITKGRRYSTDINGAYSGQFEVRTYNENQQISKFAEYTTSVNHITGTRDTSINYIEEYEYENSLLTSLTKGYQYAGAEQLKEYWAYDTHGRQSLHLIKDIFTSDSILYFYTDENRMNYSVRYRTWSNRVEKYYYSETDSSLTTQIKRQYFEALPILDSIADWDKKTIQYTEFYNPKGQLIQFNYRNDHDHYTDWKYNPIHYYQVFLQYNNAGNLTKVIYYIADSANSPYAESIRISLLYDAENRLKQYKNTFFDGAINDWSLDEKKIYFYSSTSSHVNVTHTPKLKIYPNPASRQITIADKTYMGMNYKISDFTGTTLLSGKLLQPSIHISDLPPNTYILTLYNQSGKYSSLFLKVRDRGNN